MAYKSNKPKRTGPICRWRRGWPIIEPFSREAHTVDANCSLWTLWACLRPCTWPAWPAQLAQAWAGLPQVVQQLLFAPMYPVSPAQARLCLSSKRQPGWEANRHQLPHRDSVCHLAVVGQAHNNKQKWTWMKGEWGCSSITVTTTDQSFSMQ